MRVEKKGGTIRKQENFFYGGYRRFSFFFEKKPSISQMTINGRVTMNSIKKPTGTSTNVAGISMT